MSKVTFYGASGTVTGSCYFLQGKSTNLLVDFGMFQGTADIEKLNFEKPHINPNEITAVLLTHAHLDHCGRLPLLSQMGYKGPIYMTRATRDLTDLSLHDSARISEENAKNGEPGLYDTKDAESVISQFEAFDYDENFKIGEFEVTPRDAGHILGSASLEVVDSNGASLVFSGDLGNTPQDLIKPTRLIDYADVVIMESTYGDKTHPKQDPRDKILSEINEIEKNGGTLLIPCFSLERTQELLHIIHHLKQNGQVKPDTQIYLDSPMAQKATTIFRSHRELFNPELTVDQLKADPFSFAGLHLVDSHQESLRLTTKSGPKVIMAGSGMMTGGRIVNHAEKLLDEPSTRLLFVGYQAEGTFGRQILDGTRKVKAHVEKDDGLSSHADQPRLINWLKHISGVKKVILTHGEDPQRQALKQKIEASLKLTEIALPRLGEVLDLP